MKNQNNIELFDYYTGIIFARLIDEFPLPIDINALKIIKDSVIDDDDVNRHTAIAYFTGIWLRDNGFIKLENSSSYSRVLSSAVLTAKGLEILKQVPQSLDGKSFGDTLKQAVKVGKEELIKTTVNKVFSISIIGLQKLSENI